MEREGHQLVRSKMYCGDIALLHDQSVCIDLKGGGMQEVYSNIVQSHDRFKRECVRAHQAGITLIILVEEPGISSLEDVKTWKNPRYERWKRDNAFILRAQAAGKMLNRKVAKSPVPSDRLAGMMDAMSMRYLVQWAFCDPQEVGEVVYRILVKER